MRRKRNLLLLGSLLAGSLALMAWAWQPFRVVGPSMEPCFVEGDWLVLGHEEPQRDDFVVFLEPGSGKNVIKRVAGVPGETVQLVDGDLYLDGAAHQRDYTSVEDLVPMVDAVGEEADAVLRLREHGFEKSDEHFWKLQGNGVAYLQRPPSADYLLRGQHIEGELPAKDLGLEVEYGLLATGSELHMVLRKGKATFLAVLSKEGSHLRIEQLNVDGQVEHLLFDQALSTKHESGHAFFTLADGGATFVLDEEVLVAGAPYPIPEPHRLSEVPLEFRNFEHAGVGGIGPLLLGRVRLGRDILYRSTGTYGVSEAFQLADGQYFLLGDNPTQSRDSRDYGAVPSDRILGTVSSRLWPRGWTERGWPVD